MIKLLRSREQYTAIDRRALVCMLLCLAFAGVAALIVLPLALGYFGIPSQRVIASVSYVVLVTAVAGMSAQLRFSPVRVPLHTTYADFRKCFWVVSLWTGPAIIFSLQRGLVGILGIGTFAIAIARVLKQVSRPNAVKSQIPDMQAILFASGSLYIGDVGPNVIRSALVSVAYLGITAELIGNRLLAIVCTAGGWFFLAWVANDRGQQARPLQIQRASTLLIHAGLAVAATFIGLLAHVEHLRLASIGTGPSETQNSDSNNEHLQSGIILFTKKRVNVHFFVPRSRTLHTGTPRSSEILRIPFSGEYWFSRWPLLRPAATSVREEGDPTTVSVTLRAFGSLVMQARQNIGRPLDVYCCHSINVVLRDGRTRTEAVTMELLIIDSSRAGHNSQSLGVQSLANPIQALADSAGEIGTTYKFEMTRHSVIHSFDSLGVWFHLQPPQTRQSAMLSIERFELVP